MKSHCRLSCILAPLVAALVILVACGTAPSPAQLPSGPGLTSVSEVSSSPSVSPPVLFPARQGAKWGFIDGAGNVVIDFRYQGAWDFHDGLAPVKVRGKWGYIDQSGGFAIPPQYVDLNLLDEFSEGLAPFHDDIVFKGFIDKNGKLVLPAGPGVHGASEFRGGLAAAYFSDGTCGYIDRSGQVVLRIPDATAVHAFSENLAVVREHGHGYGFIDLSGSFVIAPQFYSATPFSGGRAVVEYDFEKFEIIDASGQVVKTLPYDGVMGISERRAAVVENLEYGYVDGSGSLVIPLGFADAREFRGGVARVEDQNGKMGYIDPTGKYIWREQ